MTLLKLISFLILLNEACLLNLKIQKNEKIKSKKKQYTQIQENKSNSFADSFSKN